MKKRFGQARLVTTVALAAALGLGGLVGCAQAGGDAGNSASTTASTETASTAEGTATSGADSTTQEQQTGMANPWSGADTAAEAGNGAGVGGFELMDTVDASGVQFVTPVFFYTDGVAQATYNSEKADGTTLVIRKSNTLSGKEGLAGDYNEYAKTWTQDHKGLEVSCYGNDEGAAQLILWQVDGDSYSASIYGVGDGLPTLSPDDVASLVSGVQ